MFVRRLLIMVWLGVLVGPTQPVDALEATPRVPGAQDEPRELVVLLHGLGRTSVSMLPLSLALEAEGYEVLNWGYSSFCCTISELGEQLQAALRDHEAALHDAAGAPASAPRTVHFVGHSLGGIIVRWLLTHDDAPARVGKVVMLAPPNQGSEDADRYAPHLAWLLKPLPELQTDSASTVRSLDRVTNVHIGVIAGAYDGKVSPSETELAEATDYAIIPATHSFLMFRGDVHRLVLGFLREGSFPAREGLEGEVH